jgi:hypothetical protein
MSFFHNDGHWQGSREVWIFFVVSLPVTVFALFLWIGYTDRKVDVEAIKNLVAKSLFGRKRAITDGKKAIKQEKKPSKHSVKALVLPVVLKSLPEQSTSSSSSNQDLEAQSGAERTY